MITSVSSLELNLLEMEVPSFLTLPELLRLGLVEKRMRRMCQDRADHIVKCELECVYPWESSNARANQIPKWVRLRGVRRPYLFLRSYCNHWHADTKPLGFALDTKGPIFVEFSVQAQKANNGTPTIGLVDEASFQKMHQSTFRGGAFLENCGDLSRTPSDVGFAMSLCPARGTVFVAQEPGSNVQLVDFVGANKEVEHERYKANLNWWQLGDERRRRNRAIDCGFLLRDGRLTFYRAEKGFWHSSGVVCEGLPERVVPCMFLFSFIGYGQVWFSGLHQHAPPVCPGCDRMNHGTTCGWMSMP